MSDDYSTKTVRELLTPIMRQADSTGHYLPSPATGGLRVVFDAAIARDERLTAIEAHWNHLHQPCTGFTIYRKMTWKKLGEYFLDREVPS